MQFLLRLSILPLIAVFQMPATSTAQTSSQSPATLAATDKTPVSVRWNRLVPKFSAEAAASRKAARAAAKAANDSATLRRIAMTPPLMPFRVYTLLSVAQYAAANAARDERTASADAASATASAAILTRLYTDSAVRASIALELARDLEQARSGGRRTEATIAGQRLGEDVAARVIASSPPDLPLAAPFSGTVPTGPGMWYSAPGIPPIGIAVAHTRGWMLDSASQFRPAPPPAYGSPVFTAAIDEVRRIARDRTPQQTAIAQQWDSGDPWTRWNEITSDVIRRNGMSDLDAARVLALLNVGATDAIIACFEAKYHYWTIRPSQADSTIALADSIGLPNFPSYPSGHACSAGAFDAVLGHFFPKQRAEFTKLAEEQAMSRLYGGIHYRFDNDTGLALGRTVARYDVKREQSGGLNGWRSKGVARKP
jgi:hypothetical protein